MAKFPVPARGATMSSKLGVQFLGLRYYYPSTEKLNRSTQFGTVGYIITLYSSKSYVKKLGVRPNFVVRTPRSPVVAPMVPARTYFRYLLLRSSHFFSHRSPHTIFDPLCSAPLHFLLQSCSADMLCLGK